MKICSVRVRQNGAAPLKKGVVQMKTEDVLLLLNLLAAVIFGILSLVLK